MKVDDSYSDEQDISVMNTSDMDTSEMLTEYDNGFTRLKSNAFEEHKNLTEPRTFKNNRYESVSRLEKVVLVTTL